MSSQPTVCKSLCHLPVSASCLRHLTVQCSPAPAFFGSWSSCASACLLPLVMPRAPCVMEWPTATARCCPCGGDGVKRHNRLRAVVAARAQAAGLMVWGWRSRSLACCVWDAEEDGADVGRGTGDVCLHGPAALDLAVTSGLRAGATSAAAVEAYEAHKCTHLHTDQHCTSEGLQFVPLVAEACSEGWGPTAAATWRVPGARSGDSPSVETDRLLQCLSVAPPARGGGLSFLSLLFSRPSLGSVKLLQPPFRHLPCSLSPH